MSVQESQKVLVVEDDPAIRHLLSTVLKRKGYSVDQAENGADAINAINAETYAAILIDLMMPVMSGYDLIRWMESEQRKLLGCVIVLTAVTENQLQSIDRRVVFDVVRKPFDLQQVVQTVEHCIATRPRPHHADSGQSGQDG